MPGVFVMSSVTINAEAQAPSGLDSFKQTALYRFLLFPIGQMFVFILGATVLLTAFVYVLAVLFPEPRPNVILVEQINRQLPGMIISGISIGFVYAMIALGYTLVYGVLKFINFAHSEIFMVGSVIGFAFMSFLNSLGLLADFNPILLIVMTVLVSGLFSGLLAVGIERVAYKPLRRAPRLVPLITAIGLSFILQDAVRAIASLTINDFNLTYPTRDIAWLQSPYNPLVWNIGGNDVRVRITSVIIVVAAVIMLLLLNYFVNGTKAGRGIRAISMDQTTAGLMGIPVNTMISLTFFIGGALGGVAGALYGLNVGTVTPYIGFFPGLKAFTAAVLGGIGNVTGALLGGILLGMIETFLNGTLSYFPAIGIRYTDIFAFGILIAVLIFRPSGLLGERVDEKV
jgi:branched-chain amino acid transport system permease protein